MTDPEELHRRVMLIKKRLDEGKLFVAEHLAAGFSESLEQLRFDADGMVIPESVDGRLRAMGLMLAHQQDREEWKDAASLADIQRAYFERLRHFFGELHEVMAENGSTPRRTARAISRHPAMVDQNVPLIREFIDGVQQFWNDAQYPAWYHTEDQRNLKAVFGGEILPIEGQNPASLYGLYVDTIILPDPFLKVAPVLYRKPKEEQVYDFVRFGLQLLQFEKLALADLDPPIIAVLPDRHQLDENYQKFITTISEQDAVRHAARIFDRDFASVDEVTEFVREFPTPSDFVARLKDAEALAFNVESGDNIEQQLSDYLEKWASLLGITNAGEAAWLHVISRMGQANDLLRRSFELRAVPVIHAETSWRWLNWKLDASSDHHARTPDAHVIRGLQEGGKKELQWLGNIPADALIEMRKSGAAEEIKTLLSSGIGELSSADPADFGATTTKVVGNLQSAFAEHERRIADLRSKKIKFAGVDIGSFVVVGGIELAAALTGFPLMGAAAAVGGMSGVIPTAKDLKEKATDIRRSSSEISRSPVGMLFKYRKKSE